MIRSYSNFKLKPRGPNQNRKVLWMKTTSNGRWPQSIISEISQLPLIRSSSNFKLKLRGPNSNRKVLKMKMTSNGRRLQNIKSVVSQQQLIGSSSNFKLKLRGPNQNWNCLILKWRWPPMEDDLEILKVEYLSNHWSDHPKILNLSWGDQTKIEN